MDKEHTQFLNKIHGGKKKINNKDEFIFTDLPIGLPKNLKDKLAKIGFSNKKVIKTKCDKIELKIANIIKNNPHKNLIKIYDVDIKKKQIIMEKLDHLQGKPFDLRKPKKNELNKYLKDTKSSLKQLNKLGIAQIDIKLENNGYSKKDKVWKVFDFDFAGIFNKHGNKESWIIKPKPIGQISPIIAKLNLKPSEIDEYLFKYFKKIKIETYLSKTPYIYIDLIKKTDRYKKSKKSRKSSKKKSRRKSSKKKSRRKSSKKKTRRKSSKKKSRRKSSKRKSRRKSCKSMKRKSCKKSKNCSWNRNKKGTRKHKPYCSKKRRSKRKSRKSKRKSR